MTLAAAGTYWPQLCIFAAAEPGKRRTTPTAPVRARRTDPATSHAAAANAQRFAASHAGRILAALDKLGSATAHEVAKETGLSVVQVDRRRHELVKSGQVRLLAGPDGKDIERGGFNVMAKTEAAA